LLGLLGALLPDALALRMVRGRPQLTWMLRPGRTLRINYYCGDLTFEGRTEHVIERMALSGTYEPRLFDTLMTLAQPGDVCLDIGANVGTWTLPLARRVGAHGRIVAFEPCPGNCAQLRRNCELNLGPALRIQTLALGLSSAPGRLYWHPLDDDAGPSGGNGRLENEARPGCVAVDVTTLDAWFASSGLPRLDLVKIDVERMELEVVWGGKETLASYKPRIVFETLPDRGNRRHRARIGELLELLRNLGYELFGLLPTGKRVPLEEKPISQESIALPAGEVT
jgi:FkbM family methyltransferase